MKRFNGIALSVAFCSLASQAALAQTQIDTIKVQHLNEVVVKGVRATKEAPYAVANIKKSLTPDWNCHSSFLAHQVSWRGVRTASVQVQPICASVVQQAAAST